MSVQSRLLLSADCLNIREFEFSGYAIHTLVNKFCETGSVCDKKRKRRRTVLSEPQLDDSAYRKQNSPKMSLKTSFTANRNFLQLCTKNYKLFGLRPYEVTVVQELKTW